ncbi:mandelate racemase/muconate lactonizing enzyme family protein [Natronorubrum sp. JWXQ-INN-674]|uniref:Mandelate racemase/muconate lactonizing enzyme family protein n=1 Tax=Natronorubrum halalkaliphilum TaxID=2691917 RepID=A0A6B0VPJ5_9EURY|nr:mandelate racemase/muconate lactonizing enzyme family protein [Natronorubrum halalkaliphilum]MXV63185.1 mandelate racemase/muconate lactonizing enzyme family protein [Natronorubrum halalkaliphilum]
MRITNVEAVPIRHELEDTFANSQHWYNSREYCLVKIETDRGFVGWGECYGPIAGNREMVEKWIAPWLNGKNPMHVRELHEKIAVRARASYHSFLPATTISGVDMALWDLRGKAESKPIHELLGGKRRSSVTAYATGHYFRDVDNFETLKELFAEEAKGHVEAGFAALKAKIGLDRNTPWGIEEDIELIGAIREAVGDDVRIMADANQAYDRTEAKWVGRRLAEHDVYYFEEPIPVEDIQGYAHLNECLSVPIAAGECWAFIHEFEHVIRNNAVSYIQPDIPSAGGITTVQTIARLANENNIPCIPHIWGSAISIAAGLQIIATIPGRTMIEFDRTPNPLRDDIVANPIDNDGNTVSIPDGPGLGIEVDQDTLNTYRVNKI